MLRRPVLYVLAALLAGACIPDPPPATVPIPPDRPERAASPVPSDPAPVCAGGLSVRPGRLDVGAGHYLLELRLVNCGRRTVTVDGFPSVRVLDAARRQFDIAVDHGTAAVPTAYRAPRRVVLRPGQEAAAVLAWHMVVQNWSSAVQGTYLEITPADGYPAQLMTRDSPYHLGNTGRLAAGAWIPPPRAARQ